MRKELDFWGHQESLYVHWWDYKSKYDKKIVIIPLNDQVYWLIYLNYWLVGKLTK